MAAPDAAGDSWLRDLERLGNVSATQRFADKRDVARTLISNGDLEGAERVRGRENSAQTGCPDHGLRS